MDSPEDQPTIEPKTSHPAEPNFRFFSLPLELRNRVYDYSTANHTLSIENDFISRSTYYSPTCTNLLLRKTWLEGIPIRNILLSNRRLSREYRKQTSRDRTLFLRDPNGTETFRSPAAHAISRCVIFMKVLCEHCVAVRDSNGWAEARTISAGTACQALPCLRQWNETLKRKVLPKLRWHGAVHLNMGLWWRAEDEVRWPETLHDPTMMRELERLVVTHPKVESLRIALFDCEEEYVKWTMGELAMNYWVSWTKRYGWERGRADGRRKCDDRGQDREIPPAGE